MLFSLSGDQINEIPKRREKDFNAWRQRLTAKEYAEAKYEINCRIDSEINKNGGETVIVSSFLIAGNWTGTPLMPLYTKGARESEEQGGWFGGLMIWEVMTERPETWFFKMALDESDPLGTTYFRQGTSPD